MTSYKERLNPATRKYESSAPGAHSTDDPEVKKKMEKTFGADMVERMTARLPGNGPKTTPFGYTSERELKERIEEIVKKPTRKLSDRQMKVVGIDMDPLLQQTYGQSGAKGLTPEERAAIGDRWAERQIEAKRKQGRLMTDQQLADWRLARKLIPGDKVRYVGPARNEITENQLIVPRETGQIGLIVRVIDTKDGRLIVFHPAEPVEPLEAPGVDKQFIDLQVREFTPGWLHLERIPDPAEKVE